MKHFDVAIIGDSLSARITATLLAKNGLGVLHLRGQRPFISEWFHSSIFTEKLLGNLGGRSCFTAPQPTQVISEHVRVTLHGATPLAEELNREIGPAGQEVIDVLNRLNGLGETLETVLWEHGGLPWPGVLSPTTFRLRCLRRKINLAELADPLEAQLEKFPAAVRTFLMDLFQGLTLLPVQQVTVASAALAWYHAMRAEAIDPNQFSDLLDKRFEQFHGVCDDLDRLENLDSDGHRWTGGHLKEREPFLARFFLIGDISLSDRFAIQNTEGVGFKKPPITDCQLEITGRLSPFLSSQIICGGPSPMRLSLEAKDKEISGLLSVYGLLNEEALRQQLLPILPFAKYAIQPVQSNSIPEINDSASRAESILDLRLQLDTNLYCADSTALVPDLGPAGASLLGWTFVNHLSASTKTPNKEP
ncbi:MAG: hypothetical protein JRE16_05620 [Deltaproteobacteria bacterium]|jgi:hypothetical protein|nr:hypothetical protein [Deltaproteobacteria bacterium]